MANSNTTQTTLFKRNKTRIDYTPWKPSEQHGSPQMQIIINMIYPVGSFYITSSNDPDRGGNPNSWFPNTTWERITDTFLWAAGDNDDMVTAKTALTSIAGSKETVLKQHFHEVNKLTTGYDKNNSTWTHSHATSNNATKAENGSAFVTMTAKSTAAAEKVKSSGLGEMSFKSQTTTATSATGAFPYSRYAEDVDFQRLLLTSSASYQHQHEINNFKTNNTGMADVSETNMPPYLPVYIWRRLPDPVTTTSENSEDNESSENS